MPDKEAKDTDWESYAKKLEDKVLDLEDNLEKALEVAKVDEEEEADILKNADPAIRELVAKAQADAEEAQALAKADRDARLDREYLEKASQFENLAIKPEELAGTIRKVGEAAGEDSEVEFLRVLDSVNTASEMAGLTKDFGSEGHGLTNAEEAIEKAAKTLQDANPELTDEQAYANAIDNDPALYEATLSEEK